MTAIRRDSNVAQAAARPTFCQTYTWPAIIIGLLVLNAVIALWLVVRAVNDPTFAAESNAYEKAVHWDEHLAQLKFNQQLGWKAAIRVEHTGEMRHELVIDLKDAAGTGLESVNMRVETFHHARAANVAQITLAADPAAPGVYRAPINITRAGLWQVRLTASKSGKTFTADETITVDAADVSASNAGNSGGVR